MAELSDQHLELLLDPSGNHRFVWDRSSHAIQVRLCRLHIAPKSERFELLQHRQDPRRVVGLADSDLEGLDLTWPTAPGFR
jgi:hypothetical protein